MTDDILSNHQPVLEDGQYTLKVTLNIPNMPMNAKDPPEDQTEVIIRSFTVTGGQPAVKAVDTPAAFMPPAGQENLWAVSKKAARKSNVKTVIPRTLNPNDIQAVFPPAGSLGDHSDVLPHILLNRSTLPWGHQAIPGNNEIPWLALLLFDEKEVPQPKVKTLGELDEIGSVFPELELEPGKDKSDKVTVIDVRRDLLERILPSADDLKYLAHVRRGSNSQDFAVVVCNRLPKRGSTSTVHLVSVAGRYKADGEFDYQDAQASNLIRLVSLYNWRFACEDKQQNFTNLLLNLNSGTLRLPNNDNADAEKYLAMGCAPLQHTMRQGDQTISWYHGPLLPGENTAKESDLLTDPIRVSDQLMRFNRDLGVFDVSYAAAWELGRFLALQSKAFSTELVKWKRSQAQRIQGQKLQESKRELTHLPLSAPATALELPSIVKKWFERVAHLEGIPFNYLVPDERMLPPESIRFFFLDWLWLECLEEGAFSIGWVTKRDDDLYASLPKPSRQITGFLLRSDVVAHWPGLLLDGYDSQNAISLPHIDRLSKDILICLFDGKLNAVDIHLKPETMQFEVDGPDEDSGKFYILQRNPDGNTSDLKIDIPWHDEVSRVISIKELAERMGTDTSAQFAFQMIEDVEKVRLRI